MIGTTYLERGRTVVVLVRWAGGTGQPAVSCAGLEFTHQTSVGAPRNVLVHRTDGTGVVRPFRGLRVAPKGAAR